VQEGDKIISRVGDDNSYQETPWASPTTSTSVVLLAQRPAASARRRSTRAGVDDIRDQRTGQGRRGVIVGRSSPAPSASPTGCARPYHPGLV